MSDIVHLNRMSEIGGSGGGADDGYGSSGRGGGDVVCGGGGDRGDGEAAEALAAREK